MIKLGKTYDQLYWGCFSKKSAEWNHMLDVVENRKPLNEFSKALYEKLVDLIDKYGDTHNMRRAYPLNKK